jgi:FkbM family methyltransferase
MSDGGGRASRRGARARLSALVIRVARALLAGTSVQRWPLTTVLYRAAFRFGHSGDEISVEFRGVTLTAPNRDVTIVPGLVGGFYEKHELDLFERLAVSSRTVLDVGANIGLYACLAARHAPDGAQIIAFEPVPENLRYLARNLRENGLTGRVQVQPLAVGDRVGEITLFTVEGDVSIGTHSVSAHNASGSSTTLRVPVTTLDAVVARLCAGPVDLLKVDVEGFEGAVLDGARDLLARHHPTLLVEFIPEHLRNCGHDPADLAKLLFASYDAVFAIDERSGTVVRCTPEHFAADAVAPNLVALHTASHPQHLAILQPPATSGPGAP